MKNENKIKLDQKKTGRLMIAATAILWGLAGVCVKNICWSSMSIMAVRSFVALLLLAAVRKSFRIKLSKKNIIAAVFGSATGILYMMGIKNTNAATAIVLQYTAPIVVLLIGILFYKRKADLKEMISVAVVFLGCLLSFSDNMRGGYLLGNILSLASGFTFAVQIVIMADGDTDAEDSMMIGNLISILICTPFLFADKGIADTNGNTIFWLFVLCVFQYGFANILYTKGCQRISDLECSLLLTLEPIFNPIPVALVCGEWMGIRAFEGFVLVIAGIVFYTISEGHKNEPSDEREMPE